MKIKTTRLDRLFSQFIRARDVCCQRCHRTDKKLECSHIYSRRHRGTRWHPMNAKLLCFTCHRWWHENPPEAMEWIEKLYGQDHMNLLRAMVRRPTKFTQGDLVIIERNLKQQLEEIHERADAGSMGGGPVGRDPGVHRGNARRGAGDGYWLDDLSASASAADF